jgi:YYY domain-containing protein
MPVYALLLATVLLVQQFLQKRQGTKLELLIALGFRTVTAVCIFACGYLFYLPFYANYQQLYVNGVGLVKVGSGLSDFLTIFGLWLFLTTCFFLTELYGYLWVGHLGRWAWHSKMVTGNLYIVGYVLLSVVALIGCMLFGLKIVLAALLILGTGLFIRSLLSQRILLSGTGIIAKNSVSVWTYTNYTYLLLFMGLCICLGTEFVYIRDFLDGGDYARMNTVFKFSLQAWFCFAIGGALVVYRLWYTLSGFVKRVWSIVLIVFVVACSVFLSEGVAARIQDHQFWIDTQTPQFSANYTPTLDGFAFAHAWYPEDANAIAWLNADVAGSPVILEAAAPVSFQWFNRVSVYTGLPDVLGWPDHVGEQRYDYQPNNRVADIGLIYTTTDSAQSLELLRYYHVHYIYVGPLEKQLYAQQTSAGLDKFDRMVGDTLRIAYRADNVTIYEMI